MNTSKTAPLGKAKRSGKLGAGEKTVKQYILDTNVLLHDPECLFKFQENSVVLPVEVLEELDGIKTEQSTERGRNARRVHRLLQELLPDTRAMEEGVTLRNGGHLSVVINKSLLGSAVDTPIMQRLRAVLPDMSKKDNRIIACAAFMKENFPPPVILVTKDVNVQLKARAIGIESEDYLNDKAPAEEVESRACMEVPVSGHEMQRFYSEGQLDLGTDHVDGVEPFYMNQYLLLKTEQGKTAPARYYGSNVVKRLKIPDSIYVRGGISIKPRNLEQQFFLDALLDESISLVTCFGKAGTGKTLLSTAAALSLVTRDANRYDGVSISRPIVSLGKDVGFLPGSLDEKMKPWLQPYFDALDILIPGKPAKDPQFQGMPMSKRKERHGDNSTCVPAPVRGNGQPPVKAYAHLISSGILEIEALCFIRGRSIARRFFILDEAQQLTPHEVKTVITRISEGSKIVLIGDPAQIDNPYVDSCSNGLVYCHNRMKGEAIAAHVKLQKGERSLLAEIGAQKL